MKILQVCKKSPTPQKDGESIAIHQISKALQAEGNEVDVLAMLTDKHPVKDISAELKEVNYSYVKLDTNVSAIGALRSVFTPTPYIVERFYSEEFARVLVDKMQAKNYDLIFLEGVFLGVYLDLCRQYSQAKVVLRTHNVEHLIWKRHLNELSQGPKRWYLEHVMVPQFESFENKLLQQVDGIIAISPVDKAYFTQSCSVPMIVVPVSADINNKPAKLTNTFSVGFLGALDWLPNFSGLRWFLDEVWMNFARGKEVQFQVAGRNFPDEIHTWTYPQVEFLGEIDDASAFLQGQHLVIVPVFSGSGMRVKVIEAMSMGKCVLSTSIGVEGIAVDHSEECIVADSAEEWIKQLDKMWQKPEELVQMGQKAQKKILSTYAPGVLAKKLQDFILAL